MRLQIGIVVSAMFSGVLCLHGQQRIEPIKPAFGITGDRDSLRTLSAARDRLGNTSALARVTTLQMIACTKNVRFRGREVTASGQGPCDTVTRRLWFPGRLQEEERSVAQDGESIHVSTLDRDEAWNRTVLPRSAQALLPKGQALPSANADVLHRQLEARFVRLSLGLLLRGPLAASVRAKSLGITQVGNVEGTVVQIDTARGARCFLVFDPKDTSLTAVLAPVSSNPTGNATARDGGSYSVQRFSDYRAVDGIRLPFRVQLELPGGTVKQEDVTSYVINPTFRSRDFTRRVAGR